MNEHYPPILIAATPNDILAVLRDEHRQQCTHDPEANPDITLSHDSTIAEWRDACDLLPWASVAEAMNSDWSVTIPMAQWHEVLEPPQERRLGAVCELLARHTKLPRVRPSAILGASCASGGAFLTVRSYLAEAGADMRGVTPSTSLHEYTRQYAGVFVGPVSRLAPGALTLVRIHTPIYGAFIWVMLFAWVALVVSLCASLHLIAVLSGLAIAGCYLGVWTIGRWVLPKSVEFHGLRTFRDLSRVIAAGASTETADGRAARDGIVIRG